MKTTCLKKLREKVTTALVFKSLEKKILLKLAQSRLKALRNRLSQLNMQVAASR